MGKLIALIVIILCYIYFGLSIASYIKGKRNIDIIKRIFVILCWPTYIFYNCILNIHSFILYLYKWIINVILGK